MAYVLLSSYRRSLVVIGNDFGTRMPFSSHNSLKVVLSLSSAQSAASTVHARVPRFLHGSSPLHDTLAEGLSSDELCLNSQSKL